jgi:hypothetical protein
MHAQVDMPDRSAGPGQQRITTADALVPIRRADLSAGGPPLGNGTSAAPDKGGRFQGPSHFCGFPRPRKDNGASPHVSASGVGSGSPPAPIQMQTSRTRSRET